MMNFFFNRILKTSMGLFSKSNFWKCRIWSYHENFHCQCFLLKFNLEGLEWWVNFISNAYIRRVKMNSDAGGRSYFNWLVVTRKPPWLGLRTEVFLFDPSRLVKTAFPNSFKIMTKVSKWTKTLVLGTFFHEN